MLGHNELVGYFLPCKIVVYADQVMSISACPGAGKEQPTAKRQAVGFLFISWRNQVFGLFSVCLAVAFLSIGRNLPKKP
ncbi:hypothetical protein P9578_18325 [Brevibacillus choshinensis]|uniref:hypothetical protein n=1 Tax=Brevibacillus choshinensis TaxID=54911 RepID=UPI002E21247D|nr:hypothetical protein [Brevibacillus choshinensis]